MQQLNHFAQTSIKRTKLQQTFLNKIDLHEILYVIGYMVQIYGNVTLACKRQALDSCVQTKSLDSSVLRP